MRGKGSSIRIDGHDDDMIATYWTSDKGLRPIDAVASRSADRDIARAVPGPDGYGRGATVAAPRPDDAATRGTADRYPAASAGTRFAALGVPRPVTGSHPGDAE